MKPILKWVGGKTQLLTEINKRKPKKFKNYFEPFVGGGAVFLNQAIKNTTISDLNKELINMYQTIKRTPIKLINQLDEFIIKYNENPEGFYLQLRNLDRDPNFIKNNSKVFRAARTIFLNKTCFNGIYRVNSQGFFNVPWNKKETAPSVYDKKNIKEISKYLKTVKIKNTSYENILKYIQKGDFIYIDPPYDKIKNDTFIEYNKNEFGKKEQIKLSEFAREINKKQAYFMISNHNTEFINEIYSDFKIEVVYAKRSVNSKGSGRGEIEELLITNY
ncbi:adenine-specific DNA methyltransferase [Mesoplasma florum W37]|uniref:Site-specific DNA-methyltransferase (adenine-specific) n=1 Tax=Mesoplasma florum TaxID=2151 RepID=A0AAD2JDI9_MESFO|nr:Dam family site-specific DNA-(adenine-N6)-methyltransferase [Mesoplasma florum]AGY41382.1 adenine-specific DNA methyltransferase [Mesoplasma florum W37]AVN59605.1 modification methylase [Mesoplasma florum]AVN65722.1 Methyl-directed repair DNA adenine methylase [Mesoplasma florum]